MLTVITSPGGELRDISLPNQSYKGSAYSGHV